MSTKSLIRSATVILCLIAASPFACALPVRFLPWDGAIAMRKIGFHDGAQIVELQELHPDKRSTPVSWAGGEVPPQLVALDRNGEDGKPLSIPLKLSPGMKSPLVIILPDPAKPSGLRAYVIEDGSTSFGWGTYRFINATGEELLVRQDKVIKQLPKTWTPVDFNPGGENRNLSMQMAARSDLQAILFSAVWEYNPNIRKLVIVLPGKDAGGGALDLKIIPEDRRTLATVTPTETP